MTEFDNYLISEVNEPHEHAAKLAVRDQSRQMRLLCWLPACAGVLLFMAGASLATADALAGRASVIDADTIEIHGERIRILDIDAPENRQTCQDQGGAEWRCGQQAALALADWIGQRPVMCETTEKDRYKRWLARCNIGGDDPRNLAGRSRVGRSLP